MGADPDALRGDVAQQGVQLGAVSAALNRVDPDEDAVHREQLFADGLGEAFVVDHGVPFDAGGGKRFHHIDEAAVFRGGFSTRDGISPREDGYGTSGRGLSFGIHAQAPRGCVLRRTWTEVSPGVCLIPHGHST